MSSTYSYHYPADHLIDDETSTETKWLAHSHSDGTPSGGTTDAWLEIDLGETSFVSSISVYNRADVNANRLATFVVALSDKTVSERAACSTHTAGANDHGPVSVPCIGHGRFVSVTLPGTNRIINLREVQVFPCGGPPSAPPPLPDCPVPPSPTPVSLPSGEEESECYGCTNEAPCCEFSFFAGTASGNGVFSCIEKETPAGWAQCADTGDDQTCAGKEPSPGPNPISTNLWCNRPPPPDYTPSPPCVHLPPSPPSPPSPPPPPPVCETGDNKCFCHAHPGGVYVGQKREGEGEGKTVNCGFNCKNCHPKDNVVEGDVTYVITYPTSTQVRVFRPCKNGGGLGCEGQNGWGQHLCLQCEGQGA